MVQTTTPIPRGTWTGKEEPCSLAASQAILPTTRTHDRSQVGCLPRIGRRRPGQAGGVFAIAVPAHRPVGLGEAREMRCMGLIDLRPVPWDARGARRHAPSAEQHVQRNLPFPSHAPPRAAPPSSPPR